MATCDQLLEGEFDGTLQGHGGRHCNHGSWSDRQRATHSKLECEDGVRVSVTDSVASSIEGTHVVYSGTGSDEVCLWWSTTSQVGRH